MANKIVTIAVLGYMRCMVGGHGIVTDNMMRFFKDYAVPLNNRNVVVEKGDVQN